MAAPADPRAARAVRELTEALAVRERELEQSDERLRLILDNAPVFIYVVDETGRFLSVGSGWLERSGVDSATVVGRSLHDVFPASADQFVENNRRVVEEERALQFEETYGGRTFLSVKVPVRDEGGRTYAVCGMSVDITDRKRVEDALRESEDRFRSFTDSLPLIVWVHDATGAQEFVNRTFCEFFGVGPEEMQDDRWRALMHPDDAGSYSQAFMECVRDRRPFHAEVRVRRYDGAWRWIESWGRPRFSPSGAFLGFVGTSADITERKDAEETARRSEAALLEADRRKDEFLAVLSHELRNPLAPMRNALEIMRLHDGDRPELRKPIEVVARQVTQLVRLVDDLLDVSRITLGRVTLRRAIVDLRHIVDDALLISRPELDKAHHRVTVDLPSQPVPVDGDRERLTQVVSNLLNNAARYTPPGGSVAVRVTDEGDDGVLLVEDNGVGMSADVLGRIFEPFVSAAPNGSGGLGIGLALARNLTELHGGTLRVSSPGPGRGSCFVVRLPLVEAARGDPPPGREPRTAQRSWRLLLVDDDEDAATTQAELLRLLGHEPEVAFAGAEALRKMAESPPDAVVLDLGLPGMDGYEVAERMRRTEEGRDVLLIAQTGRGQEEDRLRSAAVGFDAHLVKPVEIRALLDLLDSATRASTRRSRALRSDWGPTGMEPTG